MKIRRVKRSSGVRLRAIKDGKTVGVLELMDGMPWREKMKDSVYVGLVKVDTGYQRQGIATRLYEEAARIACADYGRPLFSDETRSANDQAFWRKQEAAGRAQKVSLKGMPSDDEVGLLGHGYSYVFKLSCPAPASLAGLRAKRKPARGRR